MWLSIRSAPCSALCRSHFPAPNTPYRLSNAAANWRSAHALRAARRLTANLPGCAMLVPLQPIHPFRLFSDEASIVTSWACDALLNPGRSEVRPAQTVLDAHCSTLTCKHRFRHPLYLSRLPYVIHSV
ncbi:hypothetical protein CALCODRAFT_504989, partial [Calocera cornea HHB12733]